MAILKEELEKLKEQLEGSIASSKEIERSLKEELAASKEELAKLEGELKGSVASNKEIELGLKKELAASKGELAKLNVRVGEVDASRSEITVTLELKGLEALVADSCIGRSSKNFTCGGELEIVQ